MCSQAVSTALPPLSTRCKSLEQRAVSCTGLASAKRGQTLGAADRQNGSLNAQQSQHTSIRCTGLAPANANKGKIVFANLLGSPTAAGPAAFSGLPPPPKACSPPHLPPVLESPQRQQQEEAAAPAQVAVGAISLDAVGTC